jgi:ATP-dependent Clp protease ATP-binding subunit ClpC
MERHSVSKMIGSPPGYVGYDDGGQLTEQIRRNPFSVVLLDEMEKANEEVFNLMLQIFDEGKLTDSQGVEVSFRNTIIIGTSNLGSSKMFDLGKRIGFAGTPSKAEDYGVMKEKILEETKKFFKPEFLNRVDEIIVFHPLEKEHILSIAKLLLNKMRKKVEDAGYKIQFDDKVCEKIAQLGYSPEFGARPLRRVIENHIENAISLEIIRGNIQHGKTIDVSVKDDEFCITGID